LQVWLDEQPLAMSHWVESMQGHPPICWPITHTPPAHAALTQSLLAAQVPPLAFPDTHIAAAPQSEHALSTPQLSPLCIVVHVPTQGGPTLHE
jgi:hypothetical protein